MDQDALEAAGEQGWESEAHVEERASKRGRKKVVRTPQLRDAIKEIKRAHPAYGRTRIRRALGHRIRGSESTIARVLRAEGWANLPN